MTRKIENPASPFPDRPPVVVPGAAVCSPTIEQPRELPQQWFGNRAPEMPTYPNPRGAMPTGYPTPTSPINPQPAKPPVKR